MLTQIHHTVNCGDAPRRCRFRSLLLPSEKICTFAQSSSINVSQYIIASLRKFFCYLEEKNIVLESLTDEIIIQIIFDHQQTHKDIRYFIKALDLITRYLKSCEIAHLNLNLEHIKARRNESLIEPFDPDQISKLIEYAFHNFTYVNIEEIISNHFEIWKKENLPTITVSKGISNYLDITFEEIPYSSIPVRSDLVNNFQVYINYESNLNAPISKGTSIGTITLELEEQTIYSGNILVNTDIEHKNILDYLYDFCQNFSNIFNSILEI